MARILGQAPVEEKAPDSTGSGRILGKSAAEAAPAYTPSEEKGWYGKTTDAMGQFSLGFTKELGKRVQTAGAIGETIANQTAGRVVSAIQGKGFVPQETHSIYTPGSEEYKKVREFLEPEGAAQKFGAGVERFAEFMVPAGKITAAAKATGAGLKTLTGGKVVADLAGQGLVQGLSSGAITTAQKGKFDNDAKVNALISAVFPFFGAGAVKLGTKIQTSVIKPSTADWKNGFDAANVKKYGLGGTLSQTFAKSEKKLNGWNEQLTNILKTDKSKIDVDAIYQKTVKELSSDKKSIFELKSPGIKHGLEQLKTDLEGAALAAKEAGESAPLNKLPVLYANFIKRGAGRKGAWIRGTIIKDGRDMSDFVEEVYSTFYRNLNKEITRVVPASAALNKKMSDVIPIENALIRRIPVAERNQALGIMDNMMIAASIFDPKALTLLLVTLGMKSGAVGDYLTKAAEHWTSTTIGAGLKSLNNGIGK